MLEKYHVSLQTTFISIFHPKKIFLGCTHYKIFDCLYRLETYGQPGKSSDMSFQMIWTPKIFWQNFGHKKKLDRRNHLYPKYALIKTLKALGKTVQKIILAYIFK